MPRKSMGGVAVDMQARTLNRNGDVVPGLYAVGELTGSVGINGTHGMDGMFLGPALVTGRVAGRTVAQALAEDTPRKSATTSLQQRVFDEDVWEPSLTDADLRALLNVDREGYWHFRISTNSRWKGAMTASSATRRRCRSAP